jgi:cytochrome oxidase Cu insertion factor (SCO1/SenC/PrrC family)
MNDSNQNRPDQSIGSGRHTSPMLRAGAVLWILCLIGIGFSWYQWHNKLPNRPGVQTQAEAGPDDETDDGRQGKSIKLELQADGTFAALEVTAEEDENPWSPAGIEDFSFTDTDGQTMTRKDLLGKPFVIAFIFTFCRGPCPNVTKEMRELQDRLKDYDFNLVSLTVDPERDTADVLKTYGKTNGADPGRWKFLTGNQAEIYGLIHRSFAMPVQEEEDRDRKPGFEIIHSTNIMLVDKSGRVIGKFNAQKGDEMAKLRKELKRIAPIKTDQGSRNQSGK